MSLNRSGVKQLVERQRLTIVQTQFIFCAYQGQVTDQLREFNINY